MMRGKREKALLSAACLAVALLFAACEGELAPSGTGGAASAASAVSAAPQSAPAGESPGGSPFPEGGVQQEDGVSFRLEPYTLQQDGCDFSLTYPQLEGDAYAGVNELLRERGLQLAELLLTEREKEQSAVQSAASSGAEESGAPASSLPEPKPLTLSGSSRCGFASPLFVSATYTADVSESGGDPTRDWVSLNYDIASGEEVTCADLFSDLDGLAAALRTCAEEGDTVEQALAYLTEDRLRAGLPGVAIAFEDGAVLFGYPVPHAAGDVCVLSLPQETASVYRSDSTLWDEILKPQQQ